jgi:RNA polymerase sigma-70 factor (ECF subfamily)
VAKGLCSHEPGEKPAQRSGEVARDFATNGRLGSASPDRSTQGRTGQRVRRVRRSGAIGSLFRDQLARNGPSFHRHVEPQLETRPTNPQPGQELCGASSARDRLRRIVEEHYDFIWRLLRRIGVPADGVDDAAQEVFLVALRKLEAIERGSERSFLFGTALRVASDRRRARARSREVPTADELDAADHAPAPDELTDQRRARQALDEVLDAMADDLRVVFVLYELEGMTSGEIADLIGVPAGTAASRLRRAREEFSRQVKRIRARLGRTGGQS